MNMTKYPVTAQCTNKDGTPFKECMAEVGINQLPFAEVRASRGFTKEGYIDEVVFKVKKVILICEEQ